MNPFARENMKDAAERELRESLARVHEKLDRIMANIGKADSK